MPPASEVAAFVAALPPEHRDRWDHASIDALLARARAEGHAQWPALPLDAERLATWLAERVDAPAGPAGAASLQLASLWLTCACAHGVPGAMEAFARQHGPDVDGALRRLGLSEAAAADVRQAALDKLFVDGRQKIRGYNGRGALGGWVRAVVVRQAISMGRRRAPLDLARDELPQLPALADPERELLGARYGPRLREALQRALLDLPAEDRNLLRFRFVDGLTLDELARVFDVHRATVARRLARARAQVRQAALERLRVEFAVGVADAASLVRLVRSQLDLSLSGLLAGDEA
ncbi:MAG: sigma-70 family RNA polymerase sigma factor [Myxococcales bacterium]|nr:sigma-70 family RNA polymerase sigma factor [Myxococcales bacterium]